MCIAVAARVITSVTAVSIGGCVVCWPWTFTLQILFLGFFNGGGVLRMLPRMRFFFRAVLDFKRLSPNSLEYCNRLQQWHTIGGTLTVDADTHTYTCIHTVYGHACMQMQTHTYTHMLWQIRTKAWEMFSLPCRVIICHSPPFSHSGNINRQKKLIDNEANKPPDHNFSSFFSSFLSFPNLKWHSSRMQPLGE